MPVSFRNPSLPDAGMYPYSVRCDKPNCFFKQSAVTVEAAHEKLHNHPCPWFAGGTTTLDWWNMATLVEKVWKLLDDTVDELLAQPLPNTSIEAAVDETVGLILKARARAFSETLAIFMPPFFETPADIARESKKRWNARQAGDLSYETNGIGHLRLKHPPQVPTPTLAGQQPVSQTAPAAPPARTSRVSNKNKPATVLLKNQIEALIKAVDSGIFPDEVIAKTYNISLEHLRQVVADGKASNL